MADKLDTPPYLHLRAHGTGAGAGTGTGRQSTLARLVMHNNLAAAQQSLSPPSTASSPDLESEEARHHAATATLAIPNVAFLPPPAVPAPGPAEGVESALSRALTRAETPEYALFADRTATATTTSTSSGTSTGQSSPRISPKRQNSGSHTPRIRPHATTLNIPGMTRSRASPDGRIPQRDVAAKLVIIMVGLPARGKSYITKKLQRYLSWQQHNCRIFNVGNRRRVAAGSGPALKMAESPAASSEADQASQAKQIATILLNGAPAPLVDEPTELDLNSPIRAGAGASIIGAPAAVPVIVPVTAVVAAAAAAATAGGAGVASHSANFFDPQNEKASMIREQLAIETLDELLEYLLNGGGSVGILDATNSTVHRRRLLIKQIQRKEPKLGVLFIESVCDDKDLLEANMRLKLSGPDYHDKDPVKSLEDFRKRVQAYESAYEPLGDYEEKLDMQYIKMINVGRKVIHHRLKGFLTTGISSYLTTFNLSPRQIWITRHGQSLDNEAGRLGGDSTLTDRGQKFSLALYNFITRNRAQWLVDQKSKIASSSFPPHPGDNTPPYPELNHELNEKNFCVWTSMMRRSIETAAHFEADDDYDVKNWEMLNELNAGQFEGMTYEQIAARFPEEFTRRDADKLNYIYPGVGGEGYLQVISRLRDMVREMERITDHVLIVGHRSVCRVLMAYFMDLTRDDIADLDVPLGIAYAIEPKPYGIEFHAYKYSEETDSFHELPNYKPQKAVGRGV